MKRTVLIILSLIMVFSLAACGDTSKGNAAGEKCDLDMSVMNTTMAYSQLNNIMASPGQYEGKIIRIKGNFQFVKGASQTYYICTIADNTACCSAGLEFVLKDEPAAYPPLDTEITVTGEFETYMEEGQKYCHLKNAAIKW